jgi:quinone-modifying oxidoreductase subunit QmoB
MEHKIGVFICSGYGIGEAIDLEALEKVASGEFNVPFVRTVESCEGPGLEAILADIESEGLTRVVIAGISGRRYPGRAFPDGVIVEPIALREHIVWTQPAGEEDTQMLAEDYLRMYITKIQKMELLEPYQPDDEIDKTILVVGGGVTGLTAAREAAKTGYRVHLVEKADRLGGWLAKQAKSIPTKPPYQDLEETGIEALVAEVETDENITVHLSSCTSEIAGAPGLFDVTLAGGETFRVGSIVQATGWTPVDPRERFGWGEHANVIRNIELEEMVKEKGRMVRPSDGGEVKSIAFIQCGGTKEKEHHSYCSSICCMNSLKQALYLREADEDSKAFIFYEFLRTPGHYEDFYRRAQEDPGVFLTRGSVENVRSDGNGGLLLDATETMQGGKIEVAVDLVVLAAGMVPNAADGEAIRAYIDAMATSETGDSEGQRKEAAERAESLKEHAGTEILNLRYRQGPDLPSLEYGFPDSHFICFPYETRRTGVYAAGAVRSPMDGTASREDGTGAALKAIQCVEMTSRGEAVHPRAGDQSWPDFFLQRCTQCKRCTEECPFGVLNEDEKGTPLLRATRCRRCGVCMGACPERIVSFRDYSVDIVANMIKAVEVPEDYEEKPRVLALLCENDALPALELAAEHGMTLNPYIRIVPVRCLGSVNSVWVTEAISAGYDGVILIGCKYGDDYQCHFIKGSELAVSRSDNIREKLQQMAMENERVEIHELQIAEWERLPKIFEDFSEVIETYGMNPFKGM